MLGLRIGAALIDLALLLGLLVVLALAIGESEVEGAGFSLSLHGADAGLYFALVLLYYFGLEAALGQTIGKLLLGLRVAGPDGGRPSVFRVAVRTLLRIVDWLPLLYLVGFVALLATGPRHRRLGDVAAGTSVARAQPARNRNLALAPVALLLLSVVGLSVYRAVDSGGGTAKASRAGGARTVQAANGKIVFTSARGCPNDIGDIFEIFVMDADGSDQTNLTRTSADEIEPVWSPDGRKIAFTRGTPSGPPYEIFGMNADGSGQRNLTNDPASDTGPSWSPDGRKIAFTRGPGTLDAPSDVFVMNADGSDQRNLTVDSPGEAFGPDWSPDGTRIAYTRGASATYRYEAENIPEIFVMNADGSGKTNLTENSAPDRYPAWSPDGRKIAFDREIDEVDDIVVMNADGSGQTNLTETADTAEHGASWSPDGRRIAFTRTTDDDEGDVFAMNADGTGPTDLTNNPVWDINGDWKARTASAPPPPPRAQQRACR